MLRRCRIDFCAGVGFVGFGARQVWDKWSASLGCSFGVGAFVLSEADLVAHYSAVTAIGPNSFRGEDRFSARTKFSYFALGRDHDLLLASENLADDAFARSTFERIAGRTLSGALQVVELAENAYGFTHCALAPPSFHGELKGRLDDKRLATMLCVPCFRCEFGGDETAEEFRELRTRLIPAMIWKRSVHPKISLRYSLSRSQERADEYVLSRWDTLKRVVSELSGDTQGFVDLMNYKGEVMEVVSSEGGELFSIRNRDDATVARLPAAEAADVLWRFLTA